MNDDRLLGGRPDAVEWLASGPDRAPDGLLARSLARTSVSRQRSGIVAAALGAPRMTARPQAVTPIRVWLVVALLAMAATAVAIVAGWPDRNQLVVITSPEPSQSRSPGPDVPLAVQTLTHGVTVDRSAVNPWTSVRPFPGGNPELFAGKVYDFAFNDCPAGCGPHTIQVTLGTIDEGLIYGWEPCSAESFFGCLSPQTNGPTALAIHGMTTDELVTGWWAIFGPSRVTHVNVGAQTWSIADEGTRLVALIVGQDTVIAVSLGATPGIAAIDAQGRLTEFLNAIHYVPAARPTGAPVTHELGDLSVTMPGVWTASTTGAELQLRNGGFLAVRMTVSRLEPGATLSIERQSQDPPRRFEISGATFDELAASIDAGLGDGERHVRTIGGQPGLSWGVPQHSVIGPLAAVALVEWRGAFYVFRLQLPLDGSAGDAFGALLDSVRLL